MDAFTETLRAADTVGTAPRDSARQGGADASPGNTGPSRPFLPDLRPDFMVKNDELASALLAFEAAQPGFRGAERFNLTVAARLCGWSGQGDLLAWSRCRILAYHQVMAGAVREMLAAISVNNSLPLAIGEAV